MDDVEFHDYSIEVKAAIDDRINAVLEEVAGELESQVKRNSRVGQPGAPTKNSFRHKIVDAEHIAYIGTDNINALYEEFGTGEHAITENGGRGGRKGAWYVPVERVTGKKKPTFNGEVVIVHGKNGQDFYKTNGKKPSRAFWKAYTSLKNAIIQKIQNSLKGL